MKLLLALCIILSFHSIAQPSEDYSQDVGSIDAVVSAYYDVISGSSTDPWQYERDNYLHDPKAIITKINENGDVDTHSLAEEYIPYLLAKKENIHEVELGREVSQFGQIARVWSAFEIREDPKVPSKIRGINSIQLHFNKGR